MVLGCVLQAVGRERRSRRACGQRARQKSHLLRFLRLLLRVWSLCFSLERERRGEGRGRGERDRVGKAHEGGAGRKGGVESGAEGLVSVRLGGLHHALRLRWAEQAEPERKERRGVRHQRKREARREKGIGVREL